MFLNLNSLYFVVICICQNKKFKSLSGDEGKHGAVSFFLAPMPADERISNNSAFMNSGIEMERQIISRIGVRSTLKIDSKTIWKIQKQIL